MVAVKIESMDPFERNLVPLGRVKPPERFNAKLRLERSTARGGWGGHKWGAWRRIEGSRKCTGKWTGKGTRQRSCARGHERSEDMSKSNSSTSPNPVPLDVFLRLYKVAMIHTRLQEWLDLMQAAALPNLRLNHPLRAREHELTEAHPQPQRA